MVKGQVSAVRATRSMLLTRPCLQRTLVTTSVSKGPPEIPLVTLDGAELAFAGSSQRTAPLDLRVGPVSAGGHALLGRNGLGKTLIAQALGSSERDNFVRRGRIERREGWTPKSVSLVSFESHEALLAEGGTVYQALSTRSHLSAAAKFLIVRFGLYNLLYRPVATLSTGEIRKVLIARALTSRPSLLVLDNAFDGLDVPSRSMLAEIISTTLKGFSPLLIQGVSASATAHTQVRRFATLRAECLDRR